MMINKDKSLIQASRKILNIANKILNDKFVISENEKMWLHSVSRELEEKVNASILRSSKWKIANST